MSVCAAPTCSHQSFDGSSYYVDVDVEYAQAIGGSERFHLSPSLIFLNPLGTQKARSSFT